MAKDRIDISSESAVSMPMKNLLAIISAVAVGVWAYFGVIERLNKLETNTTLLEKDLTCLLYTSPSPRDATLSRIAWCA